MKVSVCIPTFNSAAYVRECIESVLAQNGVELEVIVFDNASEDDTWEIVQSFSDPRISAFRSDQNRGMAANFNCTLNKARGEYVKLLCSDDRLEPSALSLQAQFLDEHEEICMATSGRLLIDSSNNVIATVQWFSRPVIIEAVNLRTISLVHGNIVGEPSAVMFRREAWLRAGPFRDGLMTLIDLEMWLRLSRDGAVGYLPSHLCRVRRHACSMTSQFLESGVAQDADLQITESLLHELQAGRLIRRVSIGKVAGAYLRNGVNGLRRGLVKRAAYFFAIAFRLDPAFVGLFLYLALFRPGVLGLRVGRDGRPSICTNGTLRSAPELR